MMAEPSPPNGSELAEDTTMTTEEENTQPAQDILAALRQLTNSQQSVPNAQPTQEELTQPATQPASQEETAPSASEWDVLRARVREKPSDVDAWLKLVDTAEDGGNFEQINETYEALLEAYPNTVCYSLMDVLARVTYSYVCLSLPCLVFSRPRRLHTSTTSWSRRTRQGIRMPRACSRGF